MSAEKAALQAKVAVVRDRVNALVVDVAAPPAPAPAPVPAPPPPAPAPPPPAPAPPPSADLIPTISSNSSSNQNPGPADWVSPASLPAQIPWSLFSDGAQTLAPSMNGAAPTDYRKLHVYGMPSGLYVLSPVLVAGKVEHIFPDMGDDPVAIKARLATYPLRGGPRGQQVMSPYTTWHGHTRRLEDGSLSTNPNTPAWVGVAWDGSMCFAFRDGSVLIPFKLPIATWCQDFTYHEPRQLKLFFAADTGAGKVLKVDRNTSPPTVTEFASGLGLATSLRSFGGSLYVADNLNRNIWKIDPSTGAKSILCSLPGVFWLDYTSAGELVAMTQQRQMHKIDVTTGAIGPDLLASLPASGQLWVQFEVDRNGTFGERDAIYVIHSHGVGNTDLFQVSSAGVKTAAQMMGFGSLGGPAQVGKIANVLDPIGHYPWVVSIHPDEALMAVQGFANNQLALIAAKPAGVTWPVDPPVDNVSHARGKYLVRNGCGLGTRIGTVPSFTSLINADGGGHLGLSSDYVAEMSYPAAVAFVRAGMGGTWPRDFILGEDMYALLYYLYRNSQRFLREGKPLLDGLRAYCTAANVGTALTALNQTQPNPNGTDWFLEATVTTAGALQVVGAKPIWPTAMLDSVVVRIVIDKGRPGEVVIDNIAKPWTAPMPALAAGQHATFVELVSGGGGAPYWSRAVTFVKT